MFGEEVDFERIPFDLPDCAAACPDMKSLLTNWQQFNTFSDMLASAGMTDFNPEQVPTELLNVLGEMSGESFDDAIPGDRERAVTYGRSMLGDSFRLMRGLGESFENDIKAKADKCGGKEVKARINKDGAKFIVSMCGALFATECLHEHEAAVKIRREKN